MINQDTAATQVRRLSGITGYALADDYFTEMVDACRRFTSEQALSEAVEEWLTWESLPTVGAAKKMVARSQVSGVGCAKCGGTGFITYSERIVCNGSARNFEMARRCECHP